jgi:hypothetical protein
MVLQIKDSKWKKFKNKVRTKYGKIRDYEIERTKGRLSLLVKKIKCRYNGKQIDPEKDLLKIAEDTKSLK